MAFNVIKSGQAVTTPGNSTSQRILDLPRSEAAGPQNWEEFGAWLGQPLVPGALEFQGGKAEPFPISSCPYSLLVLLSTSQNFPEFVWSFVDGCDGSWGGVTQTIRDLSVTKILGIASP